MDQGSGSGQQAIDDIARRHNFSADAVLSMLESLVRGNGTMAQFKHPEFSGSGQWMNGGMTMVSDMFNNQLKNRVDDLCSELARLMADQPDLVENTRLQSQNQGGQQGGTAEGPFQKAQKTEWWPADLGRPDSTGSQNSVRYAYFGQARRLAIESDGKTSVYDTLDHRIGGFSQQQSGSASLTFSSQHGTVDVSRLPMIAPG